MSKTRIEWCDYTINPVKGLCPVACPYCYARRMYKRFHLRSDGTINPAWNYQIRMDPDWQENLPKEPAKVFVGSTMELFGQWTEEWMWDSIRQYVNSYPQHTFIFLTKRPKNLMMRSPFPDNCWVGVSVTKKVELYPAIYALADIKCGKRFLSFEPLLENVFDQILPAEWDDAIDWVILGQLTPVNPKTAPEYAWIEAIVDAADKANIPVFIKNNLNTCAISDHPSLVDYASGMLRQECPV